MNFEFESISLKDWLQDAAVDVRHWLIDKAYMLGVGRILLMDPNEYYFKNLSEWARNFKIKWEKLNSGGEISAVILGDEIDDDTEFFGFSNQGEPFYFDEQLNAALEFAAVDPDDLVAEMIIRESDTLQDISDEYADRREIFEKYVTPNGGLR